MTKNTPERLTRWMLPHTQPERLSIDHKVQDDLAWAADEISKLTSMIENGLGFEDLVQDGARDNTQ